MPGWGCLLFIPCLLCEQERRASLVPARCTVRTEWAVMSQLCGFTDWNPLCETEGCRTRVIMFYRHYGGWADHDYSSPQDIKYSEIPGTWASHGSGGGLAASQCLVLRAGRVMPWPWMKKQLLKNIFTMKDKSNIWWRGVKKCQDVK